MRHRFLFLSFVSLTVVVFVALFSWGYKDVLDERDFHPPDVYVGWDIITYTGISTKLNGIALSPHSEIVKYEWDFNGDGIFDWQSQTGGEAEYSYPNPGSYLARFRAWGDNGVSGEAVLKVTVKSGVGEQEYVKPSTPLAKVSGCSAPDGDFRRFAVLITGDEYWPNGITFYDSLVSVYEFNENEIFLLYADGLDNNGQEDDRIYDSLHTRSIERLFEMLADTIDSDDKLYVWLFGHGLGYYGPERAYLGSKASVDPGDEEDYRESEFKLESFYVHGYHEKHLGMEEWGLLYKWSYPDDWYYRVRYLSHFDSTYIENLGWRWDQDSLIEKFLDRPLADTNQDWKLDIYNEGPLLDWDEDGNPPYDSLTGLFDDDDWGNVDSLQQLDLCCARPIGDSFAYYPTRFWDYGLDNHVDIDVEYDSEVGYEVDGTDVDNQGRFDWIDANDDGDTTDWVSIDELYWIGASHYLYDDDLKDHLSNICANTIVVIPQQCFSGGFIEDLSKSQRVIFTNSGEEEVSYTSFTDGLLDALMWCDGVDADTNNDGCVSMVEAFNYAADYDNYYHPEITPEFDDDGDGIGHAYPIPNGDDGDFGQYTFLQECVGLDYVYGDANDDESASVADIVYLNNYLYYSGPPPLPWAAGDPNSDCLITIADIVYLSNYIFKSGPAPLEGCTW